MVKILDRLSRSLTHGWNAFQDQPKTDTDETFFRTGTTVSYGHRPDAIRSRRGNDRSMLNTIKTRIAMDAAAIPIKHVKLDENDMFQSVMRSKLNRCLTVEANLDQGARHFRQDIYEQMCDKGTIAIVPIDTVGNPYEGEKGSYDIKSLRIGEIVAWYPRDVEVSVYNDAVGEFQILKKPKKLVAIVENPLYSIMNATNSTLQRLIRKLNLLDHVDEQTSSGKLDIIIQLPYVIKSESRKQQAEQRRKDLEDQMSGSKYGVAYADGTERITQLNRPAENNLLAQVQYLTDRLYSEIGLPKDVVEGTADEAALIQYHNRTTEPMVAAVTEGMTRTFLTETAISQRQSVIGLRDPLKSIPMSQAAEFADKLTRNEIFDRNEMRAVFGRAPKTDAKASQLYNSNIPQQDQTPPKTEPTEERSDPSKWETPQSQTSADGQPKQD